MLSILEIAPIVSKNYNVYSIFLLTNTWLSLKKGSTIVFPRNKGSWLSNTRELLDFYYKNHPKL